MLNRRFRLWIVAGLVSVAGMISLGAFMSGEPFAKSQGHQQLFIGMDDKGDFQKALNDALHKAQKAAGCCDILVNYRVTDIQGQVGGFAGFNQVRVVIAASW